MTSWTENQVKNSADAPQPYGGSEGVQTTDSFTQGQQQGQEKWSTDADTSQRSDVPTSQRAGDHPRAGGQPEPFPGAASGATGGGGPTESSMQAHPLSCYENVPGTATWDSQRASMGTGTQYGQSESKVESGTGTTPEGEGKTAPEAAGTTAQGTAPKGLKGVVSSVHGAGEAFRGKVLQGLDEMFGNEEGAEKNRGIAEAGMGKMKGFGVGGHGGNQRTAPGPGASGESQTEPKAQAGDAGLRETRY